MDDAGKMTVTRLALLPATILAVAFSGCGLQMTNELARALQARSLRTGLVLGTESNTGQMSVIVPGTQIVRSVALVHPIDVGAIAPSGRGLAGRMHGTISEGIRDWPTFAVVSTAGEILYHFVLDEASGQARIALSFDLKRVVVCGRFHRKGMLTQGLQVFAEGRPERFYAMPWQSESSRCGQLVWHPNGQLFAFDIDGEILLGSLDRNALEHARRGSLPSWSPDGKSLCYRPPAGGLSLVTDDGNERMLLSDTNVEGFTAWSPEGEYVAFTKGPRMGFIGGGRFVVRVSDGRTALVQSRSPVKWTDRVVGWCFLDPAVVGRLYNR